MKPRDFTRFTQDKDKFKKVAVVKIKFKMLIKTIFIILHLIFAAPYAFANDNVVAVVNNEVIT
ncbi:MAG: hypothetical protein ABH914_04595, partial [Candidatus Omnitrophota bacterium]